MYFFLNLQLNIYFFNIVDTIRQRNTYDCGLHAIAAASDIVHCRDPAKSRWSLSHMRPHLIQCLIQGGNVSISNSGSAANPVWETHKARGKS